MFYVVIEIRWLAFWGFLTLSSYILWSRYSCSFFPILLNFDFTPISFSSLYCPFLVLLSLCQHFFPGASELIGGFVVKTLGRHLIPSLFILWNRHQRHTSFVAASGSPAHPFVFCKHTLSSSFWRNVVPGFLPLLSSCSVFMGAFGKMQKLCCHCLNLPLIHIKILTNYTWCVYLRHFTRMLQLYENIP